MDNERIDALQRATDLSVSAGVPAVVIHLGGYDYSVCEKCHVSSSETRIIAVFENGRQSN